MFLFQVYNAQSQQVPHIHRSDGIPTPVDSILRQGLQTDHRLLEWKMGRCVQASDCRLGRILSHTEHILHHLLHVQGYLRPSDTVCVSSGFERAALRGHERSSAKKTEIIQGEPQIRMQKVERFKLHDAHVDSRGDSVPPCGDTCGRCYPLACVLQFDHGNTRLQHSQYARDSNKLLHYRFVSD